MAIARLTSPIFTITPDALIVAEDPMVVLTGENGAGKTNILEAVSLLAPGRGLRGAAPRTWRGRAAPAALAISARLGDFESAPGRTPRRPSAGRSASMAGQRRRVRLPGWSPSRGSRPAMDRLFPRKRGRPAPLPRPLGPRPASVPCPSRHPLRSRDAVAQQSPSPTRRPPIRPGWQQPGGADGRSMARSSIWAVAHWWRRCPRISERCRRDLRPARARPRRVGPGNEADLEQALRESRPRDRAAARTLVGPHRADLLVTHVAKNQPAALCSTGEQKALLLSPHPRSCRDRARARPPAAHSAGRGRRPHLDRGPAAAALFERLFFFRATRRPGLA